MHLQYAHVKSLSRVRLFAAPWTVAHQTPPIHEIFQARVLEWVAISFSRASSRPRDRSRVSHTAGRHFTFTKATFLKLCSIKISSLKYYQLFHNSLSTDKNKSKTSPPADVQCTLEFLRLLRSPAFKQFIYLHITQCF